MVGEQVSLRDTLPAGISICGHRLRFDSECPASPCLHPTFVVTVSGLSFRANGLLKLQAVTR